MPTPQPIIEILLPLIVRLFPQIARAPVLGKIIPLFNVKGATDEDLARALNREYKRPQRRGFNDEIYVVKLEDAITCVEKTLSDGKLKSAGLITLAKQLLDPSTGKSPIGDAIIACLRESVLRQDRPRTTEPPRQKYHRPATGHGKGRGV